MTEEKHLSSRECSGVQPESSERELMLKDRRLAEALAQLREHSGADRHPWLRSKSFWYAVFGALFFMYFCFLLLWGLR